MPNVFGTTAEFLILGYNVEVTDDRSQHDTETSNAMPSRKFKTK